MGSKLRLLDFIIPKLESLIKPGDTFLDLMAGTHAIGYALKPGHPILANDVQEYSRIIGVGRIENNSVTITEQELNKDIISKMASNKSFNLFEKFYTDTYFSKQQCIEIDNIRFAIEKVKDPIKKALYLTALIYAMGYCQSSPGHFAQYMPKNHPRVQKLRKLSIKKSFIAKLIENHIIHSKYKNHVFSENYRTLLTDKKFEKYLKKIKLIYVDPPYSNAQYSRFYHLLETVVKYDYPDITHKGLYRENRFQSDFCYESKVEGEFDFIASKASKLNSKLVISYSNKGLLTPAQIKKICKRYFKNVDIFSQPYKHSMQGRGMVADTKEVLIICQ